MIVISKNVRIQEIKLRGSSEILLIFHHILSIYSTEDLLVTRNNIELFTVLLNYYQGH